MRAKERGFTLLEAMVALTLVASLGIASAMMLNHSLSTEEKIEHRSNQLKQLQLALWLTRQDIEQMISRVGRDSLGDFRRSTLSQQDDIALEFFRAGRRILIEKPHSSSVQRVRYRVEGSKLIRETSNILDPVEQSSWRQQELLPDLKTISFKFFVNGRWYTNWPANSNYQSLLPSAIEISLSTERYDKISQIVLLPGAI